MGQTDEQFTVSGIVRATVSVAAKNWPYFLLLVSIGWVAEETTQLLTGYGHLFEATASDLHGKSWVAQVASELTKLISFPISAAIALRVHASCTKTERSWLREWGTVIRSALALFIYAIVMAAIVVPIYLLTLFLQFKAYGMLLLVVAVFVFLVAFLLLLLAWTVAIPVIVIEQRGVLAALRRSDLLTRYRRGTILGAMLLLGVCEFVARSAVILATGEKLLAPPEPALISFSGFGEAVVAILGSAVASVGAGIIYEQLSSGGNATQAPPSP